MASIQLGSFRLDPEDAILFRNAEPVAVGRRAVAILRALVERPGDLVTKEALMDAAWAGRAVEESNLTVQIAALRRVLGEEPGGTNWIQTLAGRGYRFVGPIETAADHSVASAQQTGPNSILALPDRPSIAVLAFQNLSGELEQEYFADGVVGEIITALSRSRWLFVIARNSSFSYKGRNTDVKQVGRELGVRYVLEGSVRKEANRVRVTAQLTDTSTATSLWADRVETELGDIFDLQDQVTRSVVGAIAPKLEQAEIERGNRKPTENLSAYDFSSREGQPLPRNQKQLERGTPAIQEGNGD
jgi:TolB-like protein